jgi:lipopolysaccharide/colanic/teichoic acid biosynthesis glycosyltransferase
MYTNLFKPILDFMGALILLIVTSPILFLTLFLLAITNGFPLLFTQKRPGRYGKIFTIYKFRTMTNETDSAGNLLPDAARLKGIGKLIRSLSLDELPQLFNVLKGDMSFIGPRPLLVEYLPLYNEKQKKRHNVKPGITGWAQVNGRNAISWQEKFDLDVWYVENLSFWLDLKIMLLTFYKVLKREGVSSQDHVTMEKFSGSNNE